MKNAIQLLLVNSLFKLYNCICFVVLLNHPKKLGGFFCICNYNVYICRIKLAIMCSALK